MKPRTSITIDFDDPTFLEWIWTRLDEMAPTDKLTLEWQDSQLSMPVWQWRRLQRHEPVIFTEADKTQSGQG